MKATHAIAFILVIIGGLNWLLVGLFNWDVSALLGGMDSMLSKIVYILVGLSAVYLIFTHKSSCRHCENKGSMAPSQPQM